MPLRRKKEIHIRYLLPVKQIKSGRSVARAVTISSCSQQESGTRAGSLQVSGSLFPPERSGQRPQLRADHDFVTKQKCAFQAFRPELAFSGAYKEALILTPDAYPFCWSLLLDAAQNEYRRGEPASRSSIRKNHSWNHGKLHQALPPPHEPISADE